MTLLAYTSLHRMQCSVRATSECALQERWVWLYSGLTLYALHSLPNSNDAGTHSTGK